MPAKVLIVGLDELGTSLGLALARAPVPPETFGYDQDRQRTKDAHALGAIQRHVLDPRKTAKEVDLVVVCLPPRQSQALLEDLTAALKPNAVLLDLTAKGRLPADVPTPEAHGGSVIQGFPVVRPDRLVSDAAAEPDPDLLRGGLMGLAISPDTNESAVEQVLEFAEALGAAPFFIDLFEMQYVGAAVDSLPGLLGMILLRSLATEPGWENIQRLAGRPLAASGEHAAVHGADLAKHLWGHRHSLLSQLDGVERQSELVRRALQADSPDELQALLDEALDAREAWLQARRRGLWNRSGDTSPEARPRGLFGNLFGMSTPRSRPDE